MLEVDAAVFVTKAISFIQATAHESGFTRVIVACSGGVDSSTVLALAVRALGKKNVLALLLPYGKLSKLGTEQAQLVIAQLELPKENLRLVDIENKVAPFLENGMDKIRQGNIIARVRMIVLYDLAKKFNALVCGTENKSEYILGYYTRFGDEASDLEPIRRLYKTQVYAVAQYLQLPKEVISAEPTAGLWHGQTDAGELGFTYAQADQILYLLFDKKVGKQKLTQHGLQQEEVEKVLNWVKRNQFKHNLPYVFKFTI